MQVQFIGDLQPKRATVDSAGYDLFTPVDVEIPAGESLAVPLQLSWITKRSIWDKLLGRRYYGRVCDKSGLALKGLLVRAGVIDFDYREEWSVVLTNINRFQPLSVKKGNKIAQVILQRYYVVDSGVSLVRHGGFGSTGA